MGGRLLQRGERWWWCGVGTQVGEGVMRRVRQTGGIQGGWTRG